MIDEESVYHIGKIGKPHGVKGEVAFHFIDDVFDRVDADYLFIRTEGLLVPFFMEEYRFKSDATVWVKFQDINDADHASRLTGCDVFFPRQAAEESDGELTWAEIIGFTIIDSKTQKIVGEITSVNTATINTLFEIITTTGKSVLIPAADELVDDVDRAQKTISMNIPSGLLEL